MAEAKALFNWNDSHLTIHKGDIISLLQQGDKWWFGELNGQVGVVPKSPSKVAFLCFFFHMPIK